MNTLQNSMFKKSKKGFTLTELAIVIAVIAILIAVLVPTFTSVITKARLTAAAEEAKNSITAYSLETTTAVPDDVAVIKSGDYYFNVSGGTVSTDDDAYSTKNETTATYAYSWQDEDNANLPTIYFTSEYVISNYKLHGFGASAVETAAESGDSKAEYKFAKVTVDETIYYYTLSKATDGTYTATYSSSNKQTTIVASDKKENVNGLYDVQLYVEAEGTTTDLQATTAATAVADVAKAYISTTGVEDNTVYYLKVTNASGTPYYFSITCSSGSWGAAATLDDGVDAYGTANTGTPVTMTATAYEKYTVEYKTSSQAKADATADAALAAFEESTSYGASETYTNTVEYIVVSGTTTSYYSVSGSTIKLLTDALTDTSSYSNTTAYYHSSSSEVNSTAESADATIYYTSETVSG